MQRVLGVLFLGAGLAFLAGEYAPSPSDREEQVAAMTRIVARATILEPETVPAELPNLRRPVASPATGTTVSQTAGPPNPTPAPSALAAIAIQTAVPPPVQSAQAPVAAAGVEIQRRLAREIQTELKRVGCYSGRLDGSWGDRSRSAMATFIARVNAKLPTTEPDVFLLSLIKGQLRPVCGPDCQRHEVLSAGRCIPRTELADKTQPSVDRRAEFAAPPQVAVAAMAPRAPLPGRMSIGGPLTSEDVRAPVTAAPATATLPWNDAPVLKPNKSSSLAAIDPQDEPEPVVRAPSAPRKVTKVKRASAAAGRPKPVKRRYGTNRSVQMLFLHPLGRM